MSGAAVAFSIRSRWAAASRTRLADERIQTIRNPSAGGMGASAAQYTWSGSARRRPGRREISAQAGLPAVIHARPAASSAPLAGSTVRTRPFSRWMKFEGGQFGVGDDWTLTADEDGRRSPPAVRSACRQVHQATTRKPGVLVDNRGMVRAGVRVGGAMRISVKAGRHQRAARAIGQMTPRESF